MEEVLLDESNNRQYRASKARKISFVYQMAYFAVYAVLMSLFIEYDSPLIVVMILWLTLNTLIFFFRTVFVCLQIYAVFVWRVNGSSHINRVQALLVGLAMLSSVLIMMYLSFTDSLSEMFPDWWFRSMMLYCWLGYISLLIIILTVDEY